ncbi:MAG: hypothetical protein AB8B53_13865 [Flavobacteriales bacterium]
MKTPHAATVEVQEKSIQIAPPRILKARNVSLLICTFTLLYFNEFYITGIVLIISAFLASRIYRLYKEMVDFDWTIDELDFTEEDVISDLVG